jgi:hypothetical protein
VAAAAAGAGVAQRDVLPPGEEDGASATRRAPGAGPPVRGVGQVLRYQRAVTGPNGVGAC